MGGEPIDPGVIELAGRVVDLARGGHPGTVTGLLAAGADPDGGGPSARETAAYFELPAMPPLLSGQP